MTRNNEVVFFLLLAISSVIFVFFLLPSQIPGGLTAGVLTPSFFPLLSFCIIITFSTVEAFSVLKKKDKKERITFWGAGEAKRALIIMAAFLFYVYIGINVLGFYLSSILLLMGVIWYLGVSRWWITPIASISVVFIAHYLFNVHLGIEFPKGIFF